MIESEREKEKEPTTKLEWWPDSKISCEQMNDVFFSTKKKKKKCAFYLKKCNFVFVS